MMDVKIVDFAELKVAAMEHRTPPELLNNSARRFSEWRKETNLSPKERCKTLGVAYDNPDTTDPQEFRFDICGEVSADVPANPRGVVNKIIPGGRCAVARHFGSHDRIGECAYYIYCEWLPGSGEELQRVVSPAPIFSRSSEAGAEPRYAGVLRQRLALKAAASSARLALDAARRVDFANGGRFLGLTDAANFDSNAGVLRDIESSAAHPLAAAESASAAARNALEDAAELGLPVVKPFSEGRVFVR